jgi:hypothetical protein
MIARTCQSVVDRFPDHELAIRRRFLVDAEFCSICENYKACVAAVRHWEVAGNLERAEEYRQLTREIEEEILVALAGAVPEIRSDKTAPSPNADVAKYVRN